MTEHPAVDESAPLYDETAPHYDEIEPEEEWLEDEPEEMPARPRRKLLSPLPVTLLVVLLVACGFFAGVEVEKGQSSAGTSSGFPAGLSALRSAAAAGTSKSTSGAPSGFPGASSGGAPGTGFSAGGLTTGEVSYVNGSTLYVTNTEGNTVKVKAPIGTTVTKTVSTSMHSVHPGDTVVVRGSQDKNGSVTASSVSVSSSSGSTSSTAGSSGSAQQLFGAG
jgi:hypothetical protein